MLVCGLNKFSQLDKKSTNKDFNRDPIIDQPCKFHVDPSSFSSFSTNICQTVWITHDGKSYVTGYNIDDRISGSLPKKTLTEDTEFILKDEGGQPCKFVSVVCGVFYTLYLVSSESGVTNFKLVFCYFNKTPNPLFVNIGKRTPRALFGGNKTSGVIDTEGGIIVLTESVFESPRKQVEATFLPGGDKPVKLACCDSFVIALGMSGRVYESEISSIIKFEIVKELSETTVVDVSGTTNFCFAVLNDGRVFGRGGNYKCKLGLPKETKSVSTFTLIESLNKHKIVSVFTGSAHSIFKTIENKMIVCGSNSYGQLFIPLKNKDKDIVYPPEEVPKCQGFTFCDTGNAVSSALIGMEAPPNLSNMKIIEKILTKTKSKVTNENKKDKELETEIYLRSQIEELNKKLSEKEEEISKLKKEVIKLQGANTELKTITKENERVLIKIKQENSELKKKIKHMEYEITRKEEVQNKQLRIFGSEEMKNYHKGKRIGRGSTSEVYEVIQETKLAMKVLDLGMLKTSKKDDDVEEESDDDDKHQKVDIEQAKKFLQESEVLNSLEDEHIIKTYGFFFGDEEEGPAIILEYCESNLKKRIKKLINEERIQIIVDIISAMNKVHSKGIIHRDLKLENILLDTNNRAKLSDFGLCTFIKDDDETMSHTSMAGSLKYMSPELLQGRRDYDEKVDVYAFGVVLFVILTKGEYPDISVIEVGNGKQAQIPSSITKFSSQLIKDCWSFEPKDRPSFSEICDRLKGNEHKLI